MIVVDTSAIIAIDFREPDAISLLERLARSTTRYIPTTAIVETTMVLSRQHGDPKRAMSDYVELLRLTPISIDDEIAGAAQDAFIRFGKGRHPARLNLCDCFSYAVARTMSVPLLFVGEDFAQTDIVVA